MFDTLFAWFEIPVVFYAYLLGAGGMLLFYLNSSTYDKDMPWALETLMLLFWISVATVGWPFVLVWWVFARMNLWRHGVGL